MTFETTAYPRFMGRYFKVADTLKNVDEEGILERFVQSMAKYLDTDVTPFVDNQNANLDDPITALEAFLVFLEDIRALNIVVFQDITFRRKIIQYFFNFVQIRGSEKAFELMFGWLGLSTSITTQTYTGFDSSLTFDTGRFDTAGACCFLYEIDLTGALTLDADTLAAINSIINFNQPINATLNEIRLNGSPISLETPQLICSNSLVTPSVAIGEEVIVSKTIDNAGSGSIVCTVEFDFGQLMANGSTPLDTGLIYATEEGIYEDYFIEVFDTMILTESAANNVVIGPIADNQASILEYRFVDSAGKLLSSGQARILHDNTSAIVHDEQHYVDEADVPDYTFTADISGGVNVILVVTVGAIGADNEFLYRSI